MAVGEREREREREYKLVCDNHSRERKADMTRILRETQWVEGWGGGGSRLLLFQSGPGDLAQVKAGGKTLTVTVGDGLPKTSSKLLFGF